MPNLVIRHARLMRAGIIATVLVGAGGATAQTPPRVTVDASGTIHSDGLSVPLSDLLSPQARADLAARLTRPPMIPPRGNGAAASRAATDTMLEAVLARWQIAHPSDIRRVTMNGVATDVVVPKAGIAPGNARRVLINLHGGGFFAGAGAGGQVEALPLAAQGRIKVVAVDYRMAPEHGFPAASEDVERVYRELLKSYRPANIGIYGCSAGGTLVAQSVAWFQRHGLPRPGAIGIFCSGAMPSFWYGGDSFAVAQMLNGRVAATPEQMQASAGNLYLAGVDQADPLVTPGLFPAVLAQFPPTLLVTSTRDSAMSNALVTNVELLKAGVQTQLLVQEGLGHGEFTFMVGSPETTAAYAIIWRFFDQHLGH